MGQTFLSEGSINRTPYDVMNNVLGNILTMSDEFHRAVYFLTTLKLGHWHHNEVCFTKKTASATYRVEEVLDMEEREEMEMGD